jgi:phosphoribosylamine-glycine ligase
LWKYAATLVAGTLDKLKIEFEPKATVCKYVVPKGYGLPADHPDAASSRAKIEVGDVGKPGFIIHQWIKKKTVCI